MPALRPAHVECRTTRVETSGADEKGCLMYADEKLVAVLV
jgi:hypothetical protein